MKYIVLIGDGMADFPLEELGGKTPLETAHTPGLDAMALGGLFGQFCPIPEGYPPGSDIGILSMYGYDPAAVFTGRAPMEAANQDIPLGGNDVCFRCNLVTLDDGRMKSFTSGQISSEEGAALIQALNEALSDEPVRFHAGVGYRNLCVIQSGEASVEALARIHTTPPHDVTDKPYADALPHGSGAELPLRLMERSKQVLADHPVNQARVQAGLSPATSIWLWGQGRALTLTPYQTRFGLQGAVVSAVDLVNGIGKLAGFEVLSVPGVTGYIDTNYEGKIRAGLDALERVDLVLIHLEAPDEISHEGNAGLKVEAIEAFDRLMVRPCLEYVQNRGDCRMVAAPDHITAISTKTHAPGPVPFAVYGSGVHGNGAVAYTEKAAADSGLLLNAGYSLVPMVIESPVIGPENLPTAASCSETQ